MKFYIMQARSDSSGDLITWSAANPDFAGGSFPGPGAPLDIAVLAFRNDPSGSLATQRLAASGAQTITPSGDTMYLVQNGGTDITVDPSQIVDGQLVVFVLQAAITSGVTIATAGGTVDNGSETYSLNRPGHSIVMRYDASTTNLLIVASNRAPSTHLVYPGDYGTFDRLLADIDGAPGAVEIFVESDQTVSLSANWTPKNSSQAIVFRAFANQRTLTINGNFSMKNIGKVVFDGVTLSKGGGTAPAIAYDDGAGHEFFGRAPVGNGNMGLVAGSQPAISVSGVGTALSPMSLENCIVNAGAIVDTATGSPTQIFRMGNGTDIQANGITSGNTCNFAAYGTSFALDATGCSGTVNVFANTSRMSTLRTPIMSGTTSQRPTAAQGRFTWMLYRDTTINKTITWNGSNWVGMNDNTTV